LTISGGYYPPPPFRAYSAQGMSVVKLVTIGLVVSGVNPFARFGLETPSMFTWALENKVYSSMMIFFLANVIEGQLISTGAFEITFNDVPVWSKIDTGRVPSPQEMFQIVENHMRLYES